jgi:Ser/Thr protein kinase RdoA (MazF antagonist)
MIVSAEVPHEMRAFIDFGDCKRSCTIFDVAIACAYLMIRECVNDYDSCVECMFNILSGYHSQMPLTPLEMDIVFVAICSRILVSVTMSAAKIAAYPENEKYLTLHSNRGWIFLKVLERCDPKEMAHVIRQRLLKTNNCKKGKIISAL